MKSATYCTADQAREAASDLVDAAADTLGATRRTTDAAGVRAAWVVGERPSGTATVISLRATSIWVQRDQYAPGVSVSASLRYDGNQTESTFLAAAEYKTAAGAIRFANSQLS